MSAHRNAKYSREWILIRGSGGVLVTGEDDRQHVVYRPELAQHQLRLGCDCIVRVIEGVVVHAVLSAVAPGRSEHEH